MNRANIDISNQELDTKNSQNTASIAAAGHSRNAPDDLSPRLCSEVSLAVAAAVGSVAIVCRFRLSQLLGCEGKLSQPNFIARVTRGTEPLGATGFSAKVGNSSAMVTLF